MTIFYNEDEIEDSINESDNEVSASTLVLIIFSAIALIGSLTLYFGLAHTDVDYNQNPTVSNPCPAGVTK